MEIVDILDSSLDEELLYYQAKACEHRVTDEALHDMLYEITSEAVLEISEDYISTKSVFDSMTACLIAVLICIFVLRYICDHTVSTPLLY